MTENNQNPILEMEDISSASEELKAKRDPIGTYTKYLFENLSLVIKAISFILASGIILMGFVVAFLLFSKSFLSIVLMFAVIIIFTLLAACAFFPIYGIGHIICQNDEILEKLKK